MNIYKYRIKLLDPLFYSREGLSAAITPKHLHATAINHAVAYAMSINSENQPYIISEANGGRNTPRYKNSIASDDFYFTPARAEGNISYSPQIVKGELDGFIRKGYPGAEILRASLLYFISPESVFSGYVFSKKELEFPEMIRLGSFRGKAKLTLREVRIVKEIRSTLVDHPIDPLVHNAQRGVMVNMFPYPVVENSICSECIEICEGTTKRFVGIPAGYKLQEGDVINTNRNTLIF